MLDTFLADFQPVPWTETDYLPKGFSKIALYAQPVPTGLEVALVASPKVPTKADMETIWRGRKNHRATPVLVIAMVATEATATANAAAATPPPAKTSPAAAEPEPTSPPNTPTPPAAATPTPPLHACGLEANTPNHYPNLNPNLVAKITDTALRKPDHHSAVRYLKEKLPLLQSEIPGLHNQGFFALQQLRHTPNRSDWQSATQKSTALLHKRGEDLLRSLDFNINPLPQEKAMILTAGERQTAVAVALADNEPYDIRASQHSLFKESPVSRATAVADRHNLDWMILTRGSEIRLYSSKADRGVGSGAREEKYLQLDLDLLTEEFAAYLYLLYSAEAMAQDGSLSETLDKSKQFAAELAARLRDRVYDETVPHLAKAVARRMPSVATSADSAPAAPATPDSDPATTATTPTDQDLNHAYEQVMHILFRLLFVAYGEARDLLPTKTNPQYADRSLTRKAELILEARRNNKPPWGETSTDLWTNATQLWQAINEGNEGWDVPAYNGGLFSTDPEVSQPGAAIANMRPLTDSEFGPALEALLIDKSPEDQDGPVDFRSLSVREFGTIYEGLLESSFSVAPADLTIDKKNLYVPAKPDEEVKVAKGEVYFHNRSGARKSTGSYFTKAFAVEHLIENALVPALQKHIERLENLRQTKGEDAAADAFFDFRCADIAMGSGHFLVAALDKIVEKLSRHLDEHPLPAVNEELRKLREASDAATTGTAVATTATGADTARHDTDTATAEAENADTSTTKDTADSIKFESLLRRQVARRCIYGVDINQVAVELAQVALWIHTFIPGLPLSFFGRNLICGDSLTGVGSLDEVVSALEPGHKPGTPSLYRSQIESRLERATVGLKKLAANSEASAKEVEAAREAAKEMEQEIAPAKALFDLVTAKRGGVDFLEGYAEETVMASRATPDVDAVVSKLRPIHFPAAFPEVFLRERPGFDCLLGNPPWEKVKIEKHAWWCQHVPKIRGLPVGKMNQAIRDFSDERPDLEQLNESAVEEKKYYSAVLNRGAFDLGSGDTDLYQAFAWRFWQLARTEGSLGILLPRTSLHGKGLTSWRLEVLEQGTFSDVTLLVNKAAWVFDDIHHGYSIVLISIQYGTRDDGNICLNGPHFDLRSFAGGKNNKVTVPLEEFTSWSNTAAFPSIPSNQSLSVFRKIRRHPRIDGSDYNIITSQAKPSQAKPSQAKPSPGFILLFQDQSWNCTRHKTSTCLPSTCPRVRRCRRQAPILRHERCKILASLRGQVFRCMATRYRQLLCLGQSRTIEGASTRKASPPI